ncbi:MAG TPA: HDOD domain-containing protein [Rhodocyclaceae bacterium]|nr:HDOD domain-containing protein [Rhodocyclaceae bacterium]
MDKPNADNGEAPPIEQALELSLRDIGIPPRPIILEHIAKEMNRQEPDFRHLVEIISADVALAAGLLRTANSPYFGFETRAKTVMQALLMLGLEAASRAIAGLVLRRVFPPLPAIERFWDGSARVARTSGWLVRKLGVRDNVRADDAYTFGLFRDCGIPILMKKFPGYTDVLKSANTDPERPFTVVEQTRCPTNHALVGSLMTHSWLLPNEISDAVRNHHDKVAMASTPQGLAPAAARMVALSQLAEHLVQRATGMSLTREWDKLGGMCSEILKVDAATVDTLLAEAPAVVADILG